MNGACNSTKNFASSPGALGRPYRKVFSFCRLGHAPGVGLGDNGGSKFEGEDLRWHPMDCAFQLLLLSSASYQLYPDLVFCLSGGFFGIC